MKKKVLIVSLFDENNIGNRLQNYALQKKIADMGMDVTIIDDYYTFIPSLSDKIKISIKGIIGKFGCEKFLIAYKEYNLSKKIRKCNHKFDKNNLFKVLKIKRKKVFKRKWKEYDLAIVGSDQVWHKWKDDLYELPYYYLQFFPKEKRNAYAASFGFDEFPKGDVQQHIKGLMEMNKISCRESSGCRLVKECTGKDSLRVLDPTLLLSVSEWRIVENQSCNISVIENNKKYVFVFFLGDITDEYYNYIISIMKENHIDRMINFFDIIELDLDERGPSEFLKLVDNAEYIFTDSFHCTVFSLLFNKKFTVFKRKQSGFEKMFGRIEDLLASKDALGHIYGGTDVKPTNNFNNLYDESIKYLENVLM